MSPHPATFGVHPPPFGGGIGVSCSNPAQFDRMPNFKQSKPPRRGATSSGRAFLFRRLFGPCSGPCYFPVTAPLFWADLPIWRAFLALFAFYRPRLQGFT